MILSDWFEHQVESFSQQEDQFKEFCPPEKTSCPCADNVNETPVSQ